jgi:hypothetical protein
MVVSLLIDDSLELICGIVDDTNIHRTKCLEDLNSLLALLFVEFTGCMCNLAKDIAILCVRDLSLAVIAVV